MVNLNPIDLARALKVVREPGLLIPKDSGLLAYAAGLLDGEGCIDILKDASGTKRRTVGYNLRVNIANTCPDIIVWLLRNFGGSVSANRCGKQMCYSWFVLSKMSYAFLTAVLPYLQIKKDQAETGLLLRDLKSKTGVAVSPEVVRKKEVLFLKLKELKRVDSALYVDLSTLIKQPVKYPTDTDVLYYLAAILDGEGSFAFRSTTWGTKKSASITVSNTDLRLMRWIFANVGGELANDNSVTPSGHKKVFRWLVHTEDTVKLLLTVHKYLIAKKERATDILLLLLDSSFDLLDEKKKAELLVECNSRRVVYDSVDTKTDLEGSIDRVLNAEV